MTQLRLLSNIAGSYTRVALNRDQQWRMKMAWKKPIAVEVACGMEINMYSPAEDDERGGDLF